MFNSICNDFKGILSKRRESGVSPGSSSRQMKEVASYDQHQMLEVETASSNQIWVDKFPLLIFYINTQSDFLKTLIMCLIDTKVRQS